jgi:hypothetical protein
MFTMTIHEYYYNDDNRVLYVEFSTEEDGDSFYRVLELDFDTIVYYSPEIIEGGDLVDIDEEFIIDVIDGYLKENDLPEELTL